MLERFVEYRDRFAPAPAGRLYPICTSADSLPLEDDSVDLAITSAVFLHMGKSFVTRAVARDRAHAESRAATSSSTSRSRTRSTRRASCCG